MLSWIMKKKKKKIVITYDYKTLFILTNIMISNSMFSHCKKKNTHWFMLSVTISTKWGVKKKIFFLNVNWSEYF